MQDGVYDDVDEYAEEDPAILERYYGHDRTPAAVIEDDAAAEAADYSDAGQNDSDVVELSGEEDPADFDVDAEMDEEPEDNHPVQNGVDDSDGEDGLGDVEDVEDEGEEERVDGWFGDQDEIAAEIASDQQNNIRHPPIAVPDKESPFPDDNIFSAFVEELQACRASGQVPQGVMLTDEEWREYGEAGYPDAEEVQVGRGRQTTVIPLPLEIWHPRAADWCLALHLMNLFLH